MQMESQSLSEVLHRPVSDKNMGLNVQGRWVCATCLPSLFALWVTSNLLPESVLLSANR